MSGASDAVSTPPLSDLTLAEFECNTTGDIWNELLGKYIACLPLPAVSAQQQLPYTSSIAACVPEGHGHTH